PALRKENRNGINTGSAPVRPGQSLGSHPSTPEGKGASCFHLFVTKDIDCSIRRNVISS
ncbi:unnamed protein product, partial [Gulo gulo]